MEHYLYILESSAGTYYVGITADLERRLHEHNRGQNPSTRGRGPWELVYIEQYDSSRSAKAREGEIKRKKRKSYIMWLIA